MLHGEDLLNLIKKVVKIIKHLRGPEIKLDGPPEKLSGNLKRNWQRKLEITQKHFGGM